MMRKACANPKSRRALAALVFLVIVTMVLTTACNQQSESHVIVSGSTSVQPYVEVLAEKYTLQHPGIEVDVQGGGSSAGIMAVESGIADIGMSSRSLKDDEQHLWSMEIAKDGLAMIVHPDNPVTDLTLEQVRGIFTGEIGDWSMLGGVEHKIHIIAREEGSGTRSAFEELVMDKQRITPKAIIQSSNGAVRQLVSGDPYAIGFISLGLVDQDVKALTLSGVEATRDNVMDDSYSLYRSFLFVAMEKPTGYAAQFIDFILSDEGKTHMIQEGLIPAAKGSLDE